MAIDWNNKMVYVLEFKRTSDQRKDYRDIRGGNVWIGACAIVQRQPKRTGGSGIEERGNK